MKKRITEIILSLAMLLTGCESAPSPEPSDTSSAPNTQAVSAAETTTETEITAMTYEIDPTKPVVALTFDDGPNITTTMQVLDVLEKYQVPASFFLIGQNINDSTSKAVKRAYDMGCEIDNHSKTHSYMNQMTQEEIRAEVDYVNEKITEITGEPAKFFRPPYIAVNNDMYEAIDMPFICGVGCNDWDNNVSVQDRIDNTLKQVKDGTIILLHDAQGNSKTVEALEGIIPALLDEGYQFVTVSELFETKGIEISSDDTNLYTHLQ